ncbi:hypothetical protein MTR_5g092085 [Medicago truncatula]|uniref:Uncharacterized protein n=1 Tax=Medicago truncatula TaxID=3880 RepID=A0A072UFG5_MEDTR|nr:hypothetical protein MTR_5g092085 [Medicago truncatula]
MPQSICIFPTRTKPEVAVLRTEDLATSSAPTKESMHNRSITLDASDTKEMAEFPPVDIGTRGTVASLIMQEIEYFSRIESNSQDRSQRNKSHQITDVGSSLSTNSRSTIVSTVESTKKKRKTVGLTEPRFSVIKT